MSVEKTSTGQDPVNKQAYRRRRAAGSIKTSSRKNGAPQQSRFGADSPIYVLSQTLTPIAKAHRSESAFVQSQVGFALDDFFRGYRGNIGTRNYSAIISGFTEILGIGQASLNDNNTAKLFSYLSQLKRPRAGDPNSERLYEQVNGFYIDLYQDHRPQDLRLKTLATVLGSFNHDTYVLYRKDPEFQDFINASITRLIDHFDNLSREDIKRVFRGLDFMTHTPFLQDLIKALGEEMSKRLKQQKSGRLASHKQLDVQSIKSMLKGIQRQHNLASNQYLDITAEFINDNLNSISKRDAISILFNLRNYANRDKAIEIFDAISDKVFRAENLFQDLHDQEIRAVVGIVRAFIGQFDFDDFFSFIAKFNDANPRLEQIPALEVTQEMHLISYIASRYKEAEMKRIGLLAKNTNPSNIKEIAHRAVSHEEHLNSTERAVKRVLKSNLRPLFQVSPEKLEQNKYIDAFECDFYFEFENQHGQIKKVNVEVDGDGHNRYSPIPDDLRDEYLLSNRGIRVIRLKSFSPTNLEKEFKKLAKDYGLSFGLYA